MSIILSIDESIEPTIIQDATIPYFNNIMIIDGDTLSNGNSGIYYGDEISIMFWGALGLKFDSGRSYDVTYTLIPGYIYRYYVGQKYYVILDNYGSIVFSNDAVEGINDFCIDFSVHKSHQFEVYYLYDPQGFYKRAKWKKRFHAADVLDVGNRGVNNLEISDRVRPYCSIDIDNPVNGGVYTHIQDINSDVKLYNSLISKVFNEDKLFGSLVSEVNYSLVDINNDLYTELPKYITGKILDWDIKGITDDVDILVPELSKNMFPALLPIILIDQGLNNRPVYEPWLIWRTIDYLSSGSIFDDDDDNLDAFTFDLVPWWA